MSKHFDCIVLGAGPGGYVAAIKGAQLGLNVAIVEEREFGGTCLNRGCIPTKALLHASELYHEMVECSRYGLSADGVGFDIQKMYDYKNETSEQLRNGVEALLKGNGVAIYTGRGTLLPGKKVVVSLHEGGEEEITADNIIIATGSVPLVPPIPGADLPGILTSDEILDGEAKMYDSITIVGGGVIGVEFATVYKSLGSDVTIIEALPKVLANLDKDASAGVRTLFKQRGINIELSSPVARIEKDGDKFVTFFTSKDGEKSVTSDAVLIAIGRRSNLNGLGNEDLGLEIERGKVIINDQCETNLEGVYAIGDVAPGIQLAHWASAQGICVMEKLAGHEPSIDLSIIPSCIYCDPEIAGVGLTEQEAKEAGIAVTIGKYITSGNSKSIINKKDRGFIKLLYAKDTDVLVGATLMCDRATDMVGEMAMAMANKLTRKDMVKAMRAHPTVNESIGEAVEDALGGAVHVMPKRKR